MVLSPIGTMLVRILDRIGESDAVASVSGSLLEAIVGVEVVGLDRAGARRKIGLMTWGRLWAPVGEAALIEALRRQNALFALATVESVYVCRSLTEIGHFPYFYEALTEFTAKLPNGANAEWQRATREAILAGREIYIVGKY